MSDGAGERSPTMDTLWDKVKQNLGEWYSAAYDKTDELARIGRKKIDIVGINREIEKHLSELGGRVYDMINKGKKGVAVTGDKGVVDIIARTKELEEQLKLKEEEIESIRREKKGGDSVE